MVFILPLTPHYSIFEMSYLEDIEHIFLKKIRLYAWIFLHVSIIYNVNIFTRLSQWQILPYEFLLRWFKLSAIDLVNEVYKNIANSHCTREWTIAKNTEN